MTKIPFPLSSTPGERPQEGAGRILNGYVEPRGEGLGPIWRRSPGLRLFVETGEETFRGAIVMPGVIYAAYDGMVMAVTFQEAGASDSDSDSNSNSDSGGTGWVAEVHDALAGADKVFLARNNNSTPDIVGVADIGAFIITDAGVDDYPDPDVGAPNAVAFLAGYFFFTYGDGKCRTSGINTTDINLLDLATAEQHPDGLVRPQPFRSQMLLCGTRSIEVWTNTANPTAFPFSYSHTIPAGLLNAHAMAGGGDEFAEHLLWVADDNTVRRLDGYTPTKVSNPDLDRLIAALADKTELEACVYSSGGHKFWQLSCAAWTWVFDINTEKWHERDSYLKTRSRITQSFALADAGECLHKWLCGDTETGDIMEISRAVYSEMGNPFRWRMESGEVKDFPNRIQVARADFDFVTGVGIATGADPIEVDPVVDVSWSNDGGVTWSRPLIRKLGRQQNARTRVSVLNTGLSGPQGRRWRLDVPDRVHVGFMGGDQSADVRAK